MLLNTQHCHTHTCYNTYATSYITCNTTCNAPGCRSFAMFSLTHTMVRKRKPHNFSSGHKNRTKEAVHHLSSKQTMGLGKTRCGQCSLRSLEDSHAGPGDSTASHNHPAPLAEGGACVFTAPHKHHFAVPTC